MGEVQRILMMAPGKRTLFLNGRIAKRLGSSTDSAMVGTRWVIDEFGEKRRVKKKTGTRGNKYRESNSKQTKEWN